MIHLLDTNILSKAFTGRSPPALDRIMAHNPSDLGIPAIVIAEIAYGIRKSGREETMREKWNRILMPFPRIAFDEFAAEEHARLRWELRHAPIGERDLHIGAVAVALGATVVTNNRREFDRVPGLRVEDWTAA